MGGTLVLAGRAKDTIVLSSGENIEPATLEDLVAASPFVAHAVIVGQDRRALGALIVPAEEAFEELASVRGGAQGLQLQALPQFVFECVPQLWHQLTSPRKSAGECLAHIVDMFSLCTS